MVNRKQRRGSNLIEFAMVMPVFLAMVGGVFEFSWMFLQHNTTSAAVRDGCRVGSTVEYDNDPGAAAEAHMIEVMDVVGVNCTDGNGATCTVDAELSGDSPDVLLTCTATVTQYNGLFGTDLFPVPENGFSSTSTTRLELQP